MRFSYGNSPVENAIEEANSLIDLPLDERLKHVSFK